MRRGEIFNLKWENLDLDRRLIKVEKTKSGKLRFIPINNTLFEELLKLKGKNEDSPYVFFNPETRKPFRDVSAAFKGACRRAKIEGLRFHDLRHTFASRLIELGADIVTVQNLLGHSTVTTTQRYTHANDDRKKRAVDLLGTKSSESPKKSEDLLHICDMKENDIQRNFVTTSFSVN